MCDYSGCDYLEALQYVILVKDRKFTIFDEDYEFASYHKKLHTKPVIIKLWIEPVVNIKLSGSSRSPSGSFAIKSVSPHILPVFSSK